MSTVTEEELVKRITAETQAGLKVRLKAGSLAGEGSVPGIQAELCGTFESPADGDMFCHRVLEPPPERIPSILASDMVDRAV